MKPSGKYVARLIVYKIATLKQDKRRDLFYETAARRGQRPGIIEKDFWVCWVLGLLFGDKEISPNIKFKGGTSLSKVYQLIERFSEDVDLLLDASLFSDIQLMDESRSSGQQSKVNKQLRQESKSYLTDKFVPGLNERFDGICLAAMVDNSYNEIKISYPRAFAEKAILPHIILEIGPMGAMTPSDYFLIKPYAAETFPDLFETHEVSVECILAERTFWEKITILHANAHRTGDRPVPERHSRHYYDVSQMMGNEVKDRALADKKLMQAVTAFKRQVYPQGWAGDDLSTPGSFKLIPFETTRKDLEVDYLEMQQMFFGSAPSFGDVMAQIAQLEAEINKI